jgi:ABC-type uncharacterized transport system substrate-binding protein
VPRASICLVTTRTHEAGWLQPTKAQANESRIAREHPDALVVSASAVNVANRRLIVEFAAQRRLPAMYATREFVSAGGLISYGVDFADLFRRAAGYVDKILRGTKPADLPVEQPTKFELVINLKTAQSLGLDVPDKLLALADEVIE